MFKRVGFTIGATLLALTVALAACSLQTASACGGFPGRGFVRRFGPALWLGGRPFRFAGANNYYLMYKSQAMVDDVLERAADNDFRVLRIWGSLDIGNEDGSNSVHGKAEGVYFQYWDGSAPAYNDRPDGLERLDYVVHRAGELGLKLVIPLVNNWQDFGGMDQYVRWADGQHHDEFYSDPEIRQWYTDWIDHLLNRTNIYTGIQYKDDPTIMTWELANEPRCKGSGLYPPSAECSTATLIDWADDVSTFIKTVDSNHLVSVGDEGFYCVEEAEHWTENCGEGVDTIAFTSLDNIDVMSFHLYPDHWGTDVAWATDWIERHIRDARRLGKPAMLGEFGFRDSSTRNPVFKEWTDTVLTERGSGALYWILSGLQDDGTYYPDYDGFTVYCPSPVCTTMSNFAEMMIRGLPTYFHPVADHDEGVTEFETPVTLAPAANDIAYWFRNEIVPQSIDLDPAVPRQQTSVSVAGGAFRLAAGEVEFVPDLGFSGKLEVPYTIRDRYRRTSNEAMVRVTVKPEPGVPIQLFSFETGTEGWAPASWNATAGTVAQSDAFATDGTYSLFVDSIDGGWFEVQFAEPLDLSAGYTLITIDLQTGADGTWHNVALQLGDAWDWCQGPGEWVPQNTTITSELDLMSLSCASPDLSRVNAMLVYFNGDGYMDNIWAK
jgi:mannan endo-1,4-beta-mannosidase